MKTLIGASIQYKHDLIEILLKQLYLVFMQFELLIDDFCE